MKTALFAMCHGILAASLLLISSPGARAESSGPATGGEQRLPPGKTPGTYAFSYQSTVAFTQEPAFPVTVEILDYAHQPVAQIPVKDSNLFQITADLAPGTYWITSSVAADKASVYWSSQLGKISIDAAGSATAQSFPEGLVHQKKITAVSPQGRTTITEKRPLLQWLALPGAVEYKVYWLVEDSPQVVSARGNGRTGDTQFRLTEDAIPDRQYEWGVDAYGEGGKRLGYWSASYFFTPGGREAFAQAPEPASNPPKGTPRLGVVPIKLESRGPDSASGLTVEAVVPGSPALEAGLQPDDLLTSFNGKSLADLSVPDFIALIRSQTVGTVVTIEFVRQGVKKSVSVTIDAKP
jgi:hypothetical protein